MGFQRDLPQSRQIDPMPAMLRESLREFMVPENASCPLGLITIEALPRVPATWDTSAIDEDDNTLGQVFVRLASSQHAAHGEQPCTLRLNPHTDVTSRWLPHGRFKRQPPQQSPQISAKLDRLSAELEMALAHTRDRIAASSTI